ncbi:MAG: TRAP transporter large permease subunit [Dehalococcoidales bacterium]|nr:TRAP transporter large permease subunit [Dehalococcoidales bacterium]
MSPIDIALICLAVSIILMFAGVPIVFSFGIVGFVGIVAITGLSPALGIMARAPYNYTGLEALLPLPLFIVMGFFVFHSGIGEDLFKVANKWMGRTPGGIAYATTLACSGFAACTGDSMAAAASMGSIALPSMKQFKYNPSLATACIVAGGTLGILIPPSGPLIVYGYFSNSSVGALFMAGIIPGIILTIMFMITIFIICKAKPSWAPPGESFTMKEKVKSLSGVWGMLVLFILIIGGLYIGVFTPSEAGAIGAFGALILGLIRRKMNLRRITESLKDSTQIVCFIFSILIGTMVFNSLLAVSGLSSMIYDYLVGLTVSPVIVMGGIIVAYLVLGMFLDVAAVMMLTLPIVIPVVQGLGFDLIWFGIIHVVIMELALITPPVGLNLFIIQGVSKEPFNTIVKGVYPFVGAMIIGMLIFCIWPDIVLILPTTMR